MKQSVLLSLMLLGFTSATFADEGKSIYLKNCRMCHQYGMGNAPKTGDKKAWEALIVRGVDQLVESAIKGKRRMPARGGNQNLTDDEVKAAVMYMVDQSK